MPKFDTVWKWCQILIFSLKAMSNWFNGFRTAELTPVTAVPKQLRQEMLLQRKFLKYLCNHQNHQLFPHVTSSLTLLFHAHSAKSDVYTCNMVLNRHVLWPCCMDTWCPISHKRWFGKDYRLFYDNSNGSFYQDGNKHT